MIVFSFQWSSQYGERLSRTSTKPPDHAETTPTDVLAEGVSVSELPWEMQRRLIKGERVSPEEVKKFMSSQPPYVASGPP